MNKVIFILIFFLVEYAHSQPYDFIRNNNCRIIENEKYGDNEKNTFDIILPDAENPTPLVIFIHGGGFVKGDKKDVYNSRENDIKFFLKNKIAFATVNYQFFKPDDSIGIGRCLNDVKSALQNIRFNAKKYNINKELIGCYGSSAGAGSSLFLAFHDDMAVKNSNTVSGESTRIKCAGAIATQGTYNIFRWLEYIPKLKMITDLYYKEKYYDAISNFYGYSNYKSFEPVKDTIIIKYDMLQMISPDDPPVYLMNLQKELEPKDMGSIQHHREHAAIVSQYLNNNNIEHEIYLYDETVKSEKDVEISVKEFMTKHLKKNSKD